MVLLDHGVFGDHGEVVHKNALVDSELVHDTIHVEHYQKKSPPNVAVLVGFHPGHYGEIVLEAAHHQVQTMLVHNHEHEMVFVVT